MMDYYQVVRRGLQVEWQEEMQEAAIIRTRWVLDAFRGHTPKFMDRAEGEMLAVRFSELMRMQRKTIVTAWVE